MGIALLVALGTMGQFGYGGPFGYNGYGGYGGFGGPGYGYGYGYAISRPAYDPIAYARFYSGSGAYLVRPTPMYPPRVINISPGLMGRPGVTGRVVTLDEGRKSIILRLPAETVVVRYGTTTRFLSLDNTFPEIKRGAIVNVNDGTITVLANDG